MYFAGILWYILESLSAIAQPLLKNECLNPGFLITIVVWIMRKKKMVTEKIELIFVKPVVVPLADWLIIMS